MTDELRYLYAIAGAGSAEAIARHRLRGIEDGAVEPIVEGPILGATSVVSARDYEERPLNDHLQDLDWLAPRAAIHQDVNAKLLEMTSAIVPVSFGAIYRGTAGVRTLLRTRSDELQERLHELEGRAEWIVSVERKEAAASDSDALRGLDAEILAAGPGRAFLLGKRRNEVVREERRVRDAGISEEIAGAVEAIGDRVYREPLIEDASTPAVARFSVLVHRTHESKLADAIARLETSTAASGYRIRLSGPWPAYRFGGLPGERVSAE